MMVHTSPAGGMAPDPSALQRLPLGFADPSADAQTAFRAALQALSMPGRRVAIGVAPPAVPGLMPATAALLLALADHETPVWWAAPGPATWLRFHTGAPAVEAPGQARFAVCALGHERPALTAFCAGSDVSPEGSTTLLLELPALDGGPARRWSGPGLREPLALGVAGLPEPFWSQWADNHARFPSGVDVILLCGSELIGLPRTTAVSSPMSSPMPSPAPADGAA
jgi:alpha-D-ribose 1-methylphosphonate 5-triphosphate synthase subunit PhnH